MVLSTLPVELLEAILKELDTRTLLLSQRVCHHFRDLISSSPVLQAHLFITCVPGPKNDEYYTWLESIGSLQLLDEGTSRLPNEKATTIFRAVTLNPLLAHEIIPLERDLIYYDSKQQGQRHEAISMSRLLAHPQGSWRSMYISNPPAESILACSIIYWPPDDAHKIWRWHRCSVRDKTGIKMSQVVDEVLRKAGSLGVLQGDLAAENLNGWYLTCVGCVASERGEIVRDM